MEGMPVEHASASLQRDLVLLCNWMWRTFSKKSTSVSLLEREEAMSENLGWEGYVLTSSERMPMNSSLGKEEVMVTVSSSPDYNPIRNLVY